MKPLKVFIAEAEGTVREGLCVGIPWERYGFTLAGDTADGELALQQCRRAKPDVLLADVELPGLDGLALGELLRQENPKLEIILMDGRCEFASAHRAIGLGVAAYLPKPVSAAELRKILEQLRRKTEKAAPPPAVPEEPTVTLPGYLEKLLDGKLTVPEIMEQGAALGLHWNAEVYNLVVFTLEGADSLRRRAWERMMQYFLRFPAYLAFRCAPNTCAVLIQDATQERIDRCIHALEDAEMQGLSWYAAVGAPTDRPSGLSACLESAMRALAYRYFLPEIRVFTQAFPESQERRRTGPSLDTLSSAQLSPEVFHRFVQTGTAGEAADFVKGYLAGLGGVEKRMPTRYFLMMTARIHAGMALEELQCSRESFFNRIPEPVLAAAAGELEVYLTAVLRTAVEMRELSVRQHSSDIIDQTVKYINKNYQNKDISLNSAAKAVNISPNYLSALFRRRMGVSFVDYLTQRRMVRAKQLLRQTNLHAGEIAREIGYPDPRYFSYVFKKTQGCTPGSFRSSENGE